MHAIDSRHSFLNRQFEILNIVKGNKKNNVTRYEQAVGTFSHSLTDRLTVETTISLIHLIIIYASFLIVVLV